MQPGDVGAFACLLPPVAHIRSHTMSGAICSPDALLSAQVGQALGARDPAVASRGVKGVELLPPWELTLTGASCDLYGDGVGGELPRQVYDLSQVSVCTHLVPHSPSRQCPGLATKAVSQCVCKDIREEHPWCGPLWPPAGRAFCGGGFFGFRFLGEGGYFEGLGGVVHSSAGESE